MSDKNLMKFSTGPLHIKSLTENGEISGYGSVFNVVDSHGSVVMPGAFKKAVADFVNGKKPKLLWQHDSSIPIGVIEELYEDGYGLFLKGRLLMDIPKAKEAYSLLKNGAIDGFSIGFNYRDTNVKDNIKYVTDIDLWEVSIVTFPACAEATVKDVKSNEKNKIEKEEKEMSQNEIKDEIEKNANDKIMFSKDQVEELRQKIQAEAKEEIKKTLYFSKEIEAQLGGHWSDVACDPEALYKKFFALFGISDEDDQLTSALKVLKKSKELFSKVAVDINELKKAANPDEISGEKINEIMKARIENAKYLYQKKGI